MKSGRALADRATVTVAVMRFIPTGKLILAVAVELAMVHPAHHREVRQLRLTSVFPGDQVVHLAPGGGPAAAGVVCRQTSYDQRRLRRRRLSPDSRCPPARRSCRCQTFVGSLPPQSPRPARSSVLSRWHLAPHGEADERRRHPAPRASGSRASPHRARTPAAGSSKRRSSRIAASRRSRSATTWCGTRRSVRTAAGASSRPCR